MPAALVSPLDNQAQAVGTPLDGNGTPLPSGDVMDDSDSGTDPSSTNPGAPGDVGTSDDPTPLHLPVIRTTKVVNGVTPNGDNFDVTFDFRLENTGTVDLAGIDLIDDLATQLGPAFQSVVNIVLDASGVTSGTAPTLNYAGSAGPTPFDGGRSGPGSDNLLNNDGTLAPGDGLLVRLTVTLDPDASGASSELDNQATGRGDDPGGMEVTDLSDDGTDPNTHNPTAAGDSGTGSHDDPSPIVLPDISVTKAVAGTPTELTNGNFAVNYRLVLENTGTVGLTGLQIDENLATHSALACM